MFPSVDAVASLPVSPRYNEGSWTRLRRHMSLKSMPSNGWGWLGEWNLNAELWFTFSSICVIQASSYLHFFRHYPFSLCCKSLIAEYLGYGQVAAAESELQRACVRERTILKCFCVWNRSHNFFTLSINNYFISASAVLLPRMKLL